MFNDFEMADVLGQNMLCIFLPQFEHCHLTETSRWWVQLLMLLERGWNIFLEFRGTPFHTISESLRQNCLTAISLVHRLHSTILWLLVPQHLERFPTYIRCFDYGRWCRCCCRRTFGYFFVSTALPRGPRDGDLVRVLDLTCQCETKVAQDFADFESFRADLTNMQQIWGVAFDYSISLRMKLHPLWRDDFRFSVAWRCKQHPPHWNRN